MRRIFRPDIWMGLVITLLALQLCTNMKLALFIPKILPHLEANILQTDTSLLLGSILIMSYIWGRQATCTVLVAHYLLISSGTIFQGSLSSWAPCLIGTWLVNDLPQKTSSLLEIMKLGLNYWFNFNFLYLFLLFIECTSWSEWWMLIYRDCWLTLPVDWLELASAALLIRIFIAFPLPIK